MSASLETTLDEGGADTSGPRRALAHLALVTLGPILAALVLSGLVLLALGVDPFAYYGYVAQRGLFSWLGLQQTLTRMAPLLCLAAALIVAFLSLVGIPPLIGFTGKLGLFIATINGGYAWLALAAVLNTVASLFYYARVIGPMYFAAPDGARPATLGRSSGAVVVLGAVMLIGLGISSGPFLAKALGGAVLP